MAPDTLSNEYTGCEFLRRDLAETPAQARTVLCKRLSVLPEDLPGVPRLVRLVPDPERAYKEGAEGWWRPAKEREPMAVDYWQTGE